MIKLTKEIDDLLLKFTCKKCKKGFCKYEAIDRSLLFKSDNSLKEFLTCSCGSLIFEKQENNLSFEYHTYFNNIRYYFVFYDPKNNTSNFNSNTDITCYKDYILSWNILKIKFSLSDIFDQNIDNTLKKLNNFILLS